MAVASVSAGVLHALSVGDCRVTALRPAGFGRLRGWSVVSTTADHDALALLVRDQVRGSPAAPAAPLGRAASAVASQCLLEAVRPGSAADPACVVTTVLRPGDLVLVTSDGVHDALGDAGLRAALGGGAEGLSAQTLSTMTIMAALDAGSADNCTVAVLRCLSG
jgi:serine/threonine protein phosphatase PrpC